MDANGGNLQEITKGPIDQTPFCSPDGQWVVYQSTTGRSVLKVSIEGGTPENLSSQGANAPAISNDGKMIAFTIVEGTVPNLRLRWLVVPSSGGAPLYSIDGDVRATSRIRFTPDGKSLAYVVNERGIANLWEMPLTGGPPRQFTDFKSDRIFDFAWSRDGKQLALSRGQVTTDVVLLTDTSK
jgi:Tol biopolymer transport system component